LKKQHSNQGGGNFKQQKNTSSKIEKTLNTSRQQQLNQTSNVLNGSANNQNSINNSSKLKKQHSNQARGNFKQQKSTASKIGKTLKTSGKQQLNQTSNVLNESANNQNSSNSKGKLKKVTQAAFKSGTNSTKKVVTKYQKELEKDDQGVKVASKGITGTAKTIKVTAKLYRKLRQKKGNVSVKTFVVQPSKSTVSAKSRTLKLKRKVLTNKNFQKARLNPLSKEKPKVSSLRKITKIPALTFKKGTLKYQKELEKGDEGVKLVSQGATAVARVSKKLLKGKSKISGKSGRLNKQSTKLLKSNFNKNKKIQVQSKAALKKKVIKKKQYAPIRNKARAFKGAMSSFSNSISKMFKSIGKLNLNAIKKFIGAKIAAAAGSGLLTILPVLIIAIICLLIAAMIAGLGSKGIEEAEMQMSGDAISAEVRQWCPLIEKEAKAQGMEAYVDLLAAIFMVESGGTGTKDIMQSSESAGYPVNYWPTEELSIRQGVKHLKNIVTILQGFGSGYESNMKLLAQAYNFGSAFAGYVGRQGGSYTLEVAEAYSRDVVAPSLGNHNGATVPYINETSIRLGKTYRYVNGGNFLYGELVGQYGGCSGGSTGTNIPNAQGWIKPLVGNHSITSGYGWRNIGAGNEFHDGVDFGASLGTPVYAAKEGKVVYIDPYTGPGTNYRTSFGSVIFVDHGGIVSIYAHLSATHVKLGDTVQQNQQIGAVGSTGRSTGAHLHFEVRINNKATNPLPFIQ